MSQYRPGRGELRRELARCLRSGRTKRKAQGAAKRTGPVANMVMMRLPASGFCDGLRNAKVRSSISNVDLRKGSPPARAHTDGGGVLARRLRRARRWYMYWGSHDLVLESHGYRRGEAEVIYLSRARPLLLKLARPGREF